MTATLINQEYASWLASQPLNLAPGDVLLHAYTVVSALENHTGEADVYLCTAKDGTQCAAKVYHRPNPIKADVAERLLALDSPHVAKYLAVGTHLGRTVEVLRYCPGGSLQGRTFTLEELRECIIPGVNEGLRALHGIGVLHRDVKPSNILRDADGKAVLIDFGLAASLPQDASILLSASGMTPMYAAPETFRSLYLKESDYFSFGVTLFELFTGHAPYQGMAEEEVARYTSIQRLPLPQDMPLALQGLIAALTWPDVTSRDDRHDPNRRWTYEEVTNWLHGVEQPIPGGLYSRYAIAPYLFFGANYTDTRALAMALAQRWDDGKRLLFHGQLVEHMRNCNPEMAQACAEAQSAARERSGLDDVIYLRFLHALNPADTHLHWRGRTWTDLPSFGRETLDQLRQKNRAFYPVVGSILKEHVLSVYIALKCPEDEGRLAAARALEDKYALSKGDGLLPCYLAAYTLSGHRVMILEGREIHTLTELTGLMQEKLAVSLDELKRFCHARVDYRGVLDPQLEAWLTAIGKQEQIRIWRDRMHGITEAT